MAQNVILFSFENIEIRAFEINGEAWFAASEVAKALGYQRPADAVRTHCKGVGETQTPSAGGLQNIKIIPERDVYRLVMRSKLPSAEQFEEKVVGEILPSIRKTGGYMTTIPNETPEETMARALMIAKDKIEQRDKQIEVLRPKAEVYDRIVLADEAFCLTDAAKLLQTNPKKLIDFLSANHWIYRRVGNKNWIAYQDKIQAGYLEHKVTEIFQNDGTSKIREQVKITPKGITKLSKLLSSDMEAA